ncbi:MAG: hypothetical protein GX081_10865, partial [Firmicutes bacterium]|nr:hypothetical protein [Bacillota bacterium]
MEKEKQNPKRRGGDSLLLLAGFGLAWLLTALKLPYGLVPAGLSVAGAW